MRNKFFLIGLLVMAVMVSACGTAVAGSGGSAQPRTISVNGSSQTILTPDMAYVSIGVHTESADAKEAVASNNEQTQAVIDALVASGVDAKDIQTINFSVYPQDKYSPSGELQGKVFAVDNTVYVKVTNLDGLGDMLDAVVQAGANTIYGITFDVADREAALAQGRKAAVDNAYQQAQQLAEAAGVSLGPVYTISYYNNPPVPVYYDVKGLGGGAAEAALSVPVSPGQMTLTVDVSVVYEIQ